MQKKTKNFPNPRHDHWCQATLLKRGWTKELISKLLPPPRLAHNRWSSTHPIKEWPKDHVLWAEQKLMFKRDRSYPSGFCGEPLVNGQF